MTTDELRAQVQALRWYHSIDLGHGVVTPGVDNSPERLARVHLPADLSGRSVLDIGAWDGFFSFEAERRGAARIVATDHYAWHGVGWGTGQGKAGFALARAALNSRVEDVDIDVMDLSPERVGVFDVVFFLGVLYHLREPLTGMAKVAGVTGEVAIVESEGIHIPGTDHVPLAMFAPHDEMSGDPTNWWAPNYDGLEALCHAAGFPRVEVRQPPPFQSTEITPCRLTVRAWKGAPAG